MTPTWLTSADRTSPWPQARVLVLGGLGTDGFACADALLQVHAQVVVVDERDTDAAREKARLLAFLDAETLIGSAVPAQLPDGLDLVVVPSDIPVEHPLLAQAVAAGIPVWGDVELAWRLQRPDHVVPWLGITGAQGAGQAAHLTANFLQAAGMEPALVGDETRPVLEAVFDEVGYDAFVLRLSPAQLRRCESVAMHSAVVLNVAGPDDPEAEDLARIYRHVTRSCVYNVAEPLTERMVEDAEVTEGARAIGFTLGIPSPSMVGVVDDILVDRAFIQQRKDSAMPLADLDDVPDPEPQAVQNVLAAAALARSLGVPATAVRDGLRALRTDDRGE